MLGSTGNPSRDFASIWYLVFLPLIYRSSPCCWNCRHFSYLTFVSFLLPILFCVAVSFYLFLWSCLVLFPGYCVSLFSHIVLSIDVTTSLSIVLSRYLSPLSLSLNKYLCLLSFSIPFTVSFSLFISLYLNLYVCCLSQSLYWLSFSVYISLYKISVCFLSQSLLLSLSLFLKLQWKCFFSHAVTKFYLHPFPQYFPPLLPWTQTSLSLTLSLSLSLSWEPTLSLTSGH